MNEESYGEAMHRIHLENDQHRNADWHGDPVKVVEILRMEFKIPEHMKVTNFIRGMKEELDELKFQKSGLDK